jgi:hypothetical protein
LSSGFVEKSHGEKEYQADQNSYCYRTYQATYVFRYKPEQQAAGSRTEYTDENAGQWSYSAIFYKCPCPPTSPGADYQKYDQACDFHRISS